MQKNKNPSTFSAWKIITEELESDNHSFTPNYSIFTFVINFGNKKDSRYFPGWVGKSDAHRKRRGDSHSSWRYRHRTGGYPRDVQVKNSIMRS